MAMDTYTPDGIVHYTTVDLVRRPVPPLIRLVQYDDTLPVLAVDIQNDGADYFLSGSELVNIRYKKADKTVVYNPALGSDETGHTLYFEITQQMTAAYGDCYATIEIARDITDVVYTSQIKFIVDRNPVQEDDIESTGEFKTFIEYAAETREAAEEAKEYAENILDQMEEALSTFVTWQIVSLLPSTGEAGVIYLVPSSDPGINNIKDEYIWVLQSDGVSYGWEKIGSTDSALGGVDTYPTPDSTSVVSSGGLYDWFSGYPWTWDDLRYGRFNYSLTNLTVVSNPTRTSYTAGDMLDLAGLKVRVYNSARNIYLDYTNICTYSPANGSTLTGNTDNVTVTYDTGDDVLTTTVSLTLDRLITVDATNATTEYEIGDTFDISGLLVSVYDTDTQATESIDLQDCTFNVEDGETIDENTPTTISVEYDGLTGYYDITVSE